SAEPRPGDTTTDPEALRAARYAAIPRFDPEWAVPIVVYLASEACTRTHHYYSNGAGRYARAFVGATTGWRPDADEPPSPEASVEHLPAAGARLDCAPPPWTRAGRGCGRARHG